MENKIVGISGSFASGKDTLAHHLVIERNFMHVSTGDMVRAVAEANYGSVDRPTLVKTANELRAARGSGVLVELALEKYQERTKEYGGLVVSGIRSTGEAEAIKAAGGILIYVDAPIETRFMRILGRKRANEEKMTLEDFKASEELEMHASQGDQAHQNIAAVEDVADHKIQNAGRIETFLAEADKAIFS